MIANVTVLNPEDYPKMLGGMPIPELIRWIFEQPAGSHERMAGDFELEMRKKSKAELRGWITLAISIISLVIAVIALVKSSNPPL